MPTGEACVGTTIVERNLAASDKTEDTHHPSHLSIRRQVCDKC